MARIMAVDYGRRRIGLAICDELQMTVRGLPTLTVNNLSQSIDEVVKVVGDECAEAIVVGLPINMDGTEGEMAQLARGFAERLEETCGVSIHLMDERLSSAGAKNHIQMMGGKIGKNKGKVDRMAAVLILETYLQQIGR